MFEKDTASVPRSILSPPGPNNANVSNTTFQILNHFSLCPIEIFCSKQKMNNPLYVSRLKSNIAYNSKKKQQKVSHQIVNIHSYYKLRKGSFYLLYSLLIVSSPTQLLIQSRNHSFLYSHSPNLVSRNFYFLSHLKRNFKILRLNNEMVIKSKYI